MRLRETRLAFPPRQGWALDWPQMSMQGWGVGLGGEVLLQEAQQPPHFSWEPQWPRSTLLPAFLMSEPNSQPHRVTPTEFSSLRARLKPGLNSGYYCTGPPSRTSLSRADGG